ncbi:Uncharacterized protein Fot_24055 [Forsythia ovata]|uniref:Uncharacterized protein n=1 Tax=Forsythia ovata TaxID=205694 RepID=A0ABD1U557_9LAMI
MESRSAMSRHRFLSGLYASSQRFVANCIRSSTLLPAAGSTPPHLTAFNGRGCGKSLFVPFHLSPVALFCIVASGSESDSLAFLPRSTRDSEDAGKVFEEKGGGIFYIFVSNSTPTSAGVISVARVSEKFNKQGEKSQDE